MRSDAAAAPVHPPSHWKDEPMDSMPQTGPNVSAGPYETAREAQQAVTSPNLVVLLDACRAAGVELGAHDKLIIEWLARYEPSTVAVVAGLIRRAAAARPYPDRPMDTSDIDPETGEEFGVDPTAGQPIGGTS